MWPIGLKNYTPWVIAHMPPGFGQRLAVRQVARWTFERVLQTQVAMRQSMLACESPSAPAGP